PQRHATGPPWPGPPPTPPPWSRRATAPPGCEDPVPTTSRKLSGTHVPTRVRVANRGEIALRIMRTLRHMGISPATVYTDADAKAPHTLAADVALRVEHYLDAEAILALAVDCAATGVHPGYGFLSENADFARACTDAGLVFIG